MAENNQELIYRVGLDTSGLDTGVNEAKQKLGGVGNVDLSKSVKTLKAELREANFAAQRIANSMGVNNEEFRKAAQRVADLKDKFQEYNQTIQAFDPDNKFQGIVSLAKGATGAIQGVSGAMAFLGVEGGKASETMAKLQGLMAFAGALNSIDDIKNSFKNLGLVLGITKTSTEGATVATKGFGTAFKAVGIGLIVSALAYLIANFDDLKKSVVKFIPALGDLGGMFNKIKEVAFGVGNVILQYVLAPIKAIIKAVQGDFKGAIQEVKNGVDVVNNYKKGAEQEVTRQQEDAAKERLKISIEERKNHVEVLKAQGKETYAIEKQLLRDRLSLEKEGSEEYKKIKQEDALLEAQYTKKLDDDAKKQADENLRKEKEAADKAKQKVEAGKKLNDELRKLNETTNIDDERKKELVKLQQDFEDKKKVLLAGHQSLLALQTWFREQEKAINDKYDKEGIKLNADLAKENSLFNKSEREKELIKLQEDFEKKKEVLEKSHQSLTTLEENFRLQQQAVNQKYDEQEAEKGRKTKELQIDTTVVNTKIENTIDDRDTPDQRKEKLDNVFNAEQVAKKEHLQIEIERLKGDKDAIANIQAQYDAAELQSKKEHADAIKEIDRLTAEHKIATINKAGEAAELGSQLLGKQTAVGKGLAVASTTISTYMAAQQAYASQIVPGDPTSIFRAVVAAAAATVAGLARVKQILAVKTPGGAGSGSTGTSAPTVATAPTINAQLATPQQPQDVRVTNQKDIVARAYIVDRDLKSNQERSNFIDKVSTV